MVKAVIVADMGRVSAVRHFLTEEPPVMTYYGPTTGGWRDSQEVWGIQTRPGYTDEQFKEWVYAHFTDWVEVRRIAEF